MNNEITYKKEQGWFITRDTGLAIYLEMKGHRILKTIREDDVIFFYFNDDKSIREKTYRFKIGESQIKDVKEYYRRIKEMQKFINEKLNK